MRVRQLHPTRREQAGVCGHWSPREVVAHLAGWDREAARRFHLFMKEPTGDIDYDLDAFNSNSVNDRSRLNWEQALEELVEAHNALENAIALVDATHIESDRRFYGWLEGRLRDYQEHSAQIEAWL